MARARGDPPWRVPSAWRKALKRSSLAKETKIRPPQKKKSQFYLDHLGVCLRLPRQEVLGLLEPPALVFVDHWEGRGTVSISRGNGEGVSGAPRPSKDQLNQPAPLPSQLPTVRCQGNPRPAQALGQLRRGGRERSEVKLLDLPGLQKDLTAVAPRPLGRQGPPLPHNGDGN